MEQILHKKYLMQKCKMYTGIHVKIQACYHINKLFNKCLTAKTILETNLPRPACVHSNVTIRIDLI